MKLVTWQNSNNENRIGIRVAPKGDESDVASATIIDFEKGYADIKQTGSNPPEVSNLCFSDMNAFIRNHEKCLEAAKLVSQSWEEGRLNQNACMSETQTRLNAPTPHPVSIRDGYAFRIHVETMRKSRNLPMIEEFDMYPTFYFTNHMVTTGPGELLYPSRLKEKGLDYELEVAIVIGKEGRNIPVEKADDYIFGFMVYNDWSDRVMWLKHESKMSLGPAKAKDFASSFGPYLVTKDELNSKIQDSPNGARWNLNMQAGINGKIYSEGNANTMHWTFAQLISHASEGVTLHPGEIIGSGTVGTGCLAELNLTKKTDGLWLKDGDEVTCEIDGLGKLINQVKMENA